MAHPTQNNRDPQRLKTCETCFRAKIRCDRTQDSGSCDRCLRLGKACVFAIARHGRPHGRQSRSTNRVDRLEVRGQRRASASPSGVSSSSDPISTGTVSDSQAAALLHIYSSRMLPHFPFVRLPANTPPGSLRQQRPCLYLAILAAASYGDIALQRDLSRSFNATVADKMMHGNVASLDLLQGLLVHTAWAHYQPRPRRYSQHLHLATSIVSDLRLDRPKSLALWNVEKTTQENSQEPPAEWGTGELRALIGTYYLSSISSIVLQKLRNFPPSDFVLDSAVKLAMVAEYPSDAYLQYIVRLQKLSEAADDVLRQTSGAAGDGHGNIATIRVELESFKSSLSFSLSDCSTLSLQVYFLELLLGQMALPGFPFGNKKMETAIVYDAQLADSLTTVVSASRSLVSFLLSMTPGEEFVITNMAWVMLSCGLSLAVRLDVLVKDPRIAPLTQQIVHFLDIRHSLRQIILRLESAAAANAAAETAGPNTFHQFLKRARAIESWHQQRSVESSPSGSITSSHPPSSAAAGPSSATTSLSNPDTLVQPIDSSSLLGADPVFFQGAAFGDVLGLGHMGDTLDYSVLNILFDGQIPPFDTYMPSV